MHLIASALYSSDFVRVLLLYLSIIHSPGIERIF